MSFPVTSYEFTKEINDEWFVRRLIVMEYPSGGAFFIRGEQLNSLEADGTPTAAWNPDSDTRAEFKTKVEAMAALNRAVHSTENDGWKRRDGLMSTSEIGMSY